MSEDPRILELRRLGARIGEGVFLGADVYIERDFAPLLTIEDGVVLARGASILLHDSALNNVAGEPVKFGRVTLRSRCYIGANATVLCGVEIGARAVIGAGAIVTRDVPPETVAAGQPARLAGSLATLIAKHRAAAAGTADPRIGYLPLPAWRERRDPEAAQAAQRLIDDFVRELAHDKR
jgi:acetyltransferase-like isoleucine patch superfamily enzyme